MKHSLAIIYWLGERALRFRWILMALLGGWISFYELTRHGLGALHQPDFEFVFEVFIMGAIMPLLGGYLLTKLADSKANSIRQKERLDRYRALFQELAQRRELGELAKFL